MSKTDYAECPDEDCRSGGPHPISADGTEMECSVCHVPFPNPFHKAAAHPAESVPVADRERVRAFLAIRLGDEEAEIVTAGLLAAGVFRSEAVALASPYEAVRALLIAPRNEWGKGYNHGVRAAAEVVKGARDE